MGYIIRSNDIMIGIDLYLSNACMSKDGSFKRLVPPPVDAAGLELDYLIATHDHGDHLDTGSLETLVGKDSKTLMIGPASVVDYAVNAGIDGKKLIQLDRGQEKKLKSVELKAVLADHGEYAPDCIGVVISIAGKRIYFTSDTCYRTDLHEIIYTGGKIDLLIVPINGKYGNPDPKDASYIASWVKPEIVMPSHFWMFAEHGGDPGEFSKRCKEISPETRIVIPAIGERIIL